MRRLCSPFSDDWNTCEKKSQVSLPEKKPDKANVLLRASSVPVRWLGTNYKHVIRNRVLQHFQQKLKNSSIRGSICV